MALNWDPIVSVIIPAFNAEAFIEETLKSVLQQTCSNLEVLVVDDGSRDCTAAIVRGFCERDPRVKFFQQKNRGVAAARNFAIQNSRAKYIAPIDADDVWHPAKLEKQLAVLEQAGEKAAVAYTWSMSIDQKGNILDVGPKWDLEGEVYQALVLRNFIGNASVPLFRRSALQRVGFYDESLRSRDAQGCEDWDICLRCAEYFEYRVVQEYLVRYRSYSQSMSYNHVAMGRSYEFVMREVKDRHPEIPAHVYRWSKSIFYLYLTHKSNVCGDLRNSLRWLLGAVREDKAVLLLPWVIRCLATRLVRLGIGNTLHLLGKDASAWQQVRPVPLIDTDVLTYEEALTQRAKLPKRVWDKIQLQRWITVTNRRSYSC